MSEEQGLTPYETREILFYKTENGEVRVEILLFQENRGESAEGCTDRKNGNTAYKKAKIEYYIIYNGTKCFRDRTVITKYTHKIISFSFYSGKCREC